MLTVGVGFGFGIGCCPCRRFPRQTVVTHALPDYAGICCVLSSFLTYRRRDYYLCCGGHQNAFEVRANEKAASIFPFFFFLLFVVVWLVAFCRAVCGFVRL